MCCANLVVHGRGDGGGGRNHISNVVRSLCSSNLDAKFPPRDGLWLGKSFADFHSRFPVL